MVLNNFWYFGHSKLNLLSKNRYFLYDLMFCKVLVHENVLCLSEVCLCLFKVSIILKESAIKSNYTQYSYLSSLIYQGIHINCVHIFFFFLLSIVHVNCSFNINVLPYASNKLNHMTRRTFTILHNAQNYHVTIRFNKLR